MADEIKPIQTWAIVELMGHVKTAGQVSEETHFGTVLLRLDIPQIDGNQAHTEFYGGSAIYRLTPCTEQVACLVIQQNRSLPLVAYALPKPKFGQQTFDGDDYVWREELDSEKNDVE